jgi:hypothetical protein
MIEILGFMVAAYGIARLAQTSRIFTSDGAIQLVGAIGIGALILLAIMLTNQANTIGSLT